MPCQLCAFKRKQDLQNFIHKGLGSSYDQHESAELKKKEGKFIGFHNSANMS
jgi:hypothetical protein